MDAPKQDLIRLTPRIELRADGDGRTLFGYMALFNEPTVINSWEGRFIEKFAPGAFRKTLRDKGQTIVPLFNHGFDPSIGDKPLGRFSTLKEDRTGLYYEVPLSDTSYNADIAALVRDDAIPGNSFRFSVVKEEWEEPSATTNKLPVRTVLEAKLMEGGPVTFPAYQATQVGIRSRVDFESWRALDDGRRAQVLAIVRAGGMGGMGSGSMDDGQMADPHDFADDNEDGMCDQCGLSSDDHTEMNSDTAVKEAGVATSPPAAVSNNPDEPARAATHGITNGERIRAALILRGVTRETTTGDPQPIGGNQGEAA